MAPRKQPWFRFYVEAVTDPKLRRLTPAQKWLWVVVLAAAKQSHIEGWLMLTEREPMTAKDVADLAGMKEREVASGIDALVRLGLLEFDAVLGSWQVVAWDRRQYPSDDATTRTRKHRMERVGAANGTAMERSINGDGTDQRQRTDTDPEEEPPQTPRSTTLALVEVPPSPPATSFETDFWPIYPKRNGKREGKPKALAIWRRMNVSDQRAATIGAKHYAAAADSRVTIAADAFRWLRDRRWEDWQEPAVVVRTTQARPASFDLLQRRMAQHQAAEAGA